MEKVFKLTPIDYRLLQIILQLDKMNLAANRYGVYCMAKGIVNHETEMLKNNLYFGCAKSCSQKQISLRLIKLRKAKLIENLYIEKYDDMFLKITNLGEERVENYFSKHKNIVAKPKQNKQNIVFLK